jgi:C4-dicarboxylate transporter DctM subunit
VTARRPDIGPDTKASIYRRFASGFGRVAAGMNTLGTFWVFCLMFLICGDIAGRTLFSSPIRGVTVIVGYSIVTAVFLQFANTLHVGRFTRADILIE